MNFEFDDRFIKDLNDIESFIALDNLERAEKFKNDIIDKISSLDFMPKRCRKSTLANDESIRDLIFKGYIIVFKIQNDTIKVLYIYKENEPKMIF